MMPFMHHLYAQLLVLIAGPNLMLTAVPNLMFCRLHKSLDFEKVDVIFNNERYVNIGSVQGVS